MAAFENLSGIAGEIRSSIDSEQFDLSNFTESRAHDLMVAAFGTPLTAPTSMVRFTFVVGGGKLVRSRYPEDLTKWVTSALREIGFVDDRSAAETFDSQGTYKQQHDTGQNLKYVIVYPHVSCAATAAAAKESNSKDSTASHSRLDVNSPEYIVTACEKATLLEIVASKTTSWSQKKRLLKCLEEAHAAFKAIEEKLMTGAVLSATEQQIYDNNNGQDEAKIVWLTGECKSMIDNGQLTDAEKKEVLANLTSKLTALEEEIALTKAENKPKKLEKLLEKQTQQLSRKKMIEQIVPIVRRCRHSEQIQQFRMKLLALQAVEDKGRSCSLTLADLKMLEEKSALEDSLAAVERSSKGWFETEEEFNAMIQCDIRDAAAKYAAKVKANKNNSSKKGSSGQGNPPRKPTATSSSSSAGYSTSSSHVAGNNWSNIGVKKVVHNNTKKASAASGGGGGGGFAAAFDGGDSDSD